MLKRIVKAVTVAVTIVCLVVCIIPTFAFADPVSATVIANAFAQAIAAYGASNGVAMTFDVASSNGIGESMHELWKNFREGTQGVDDYATLASAIFPELYYKSAVALGTVSDAYAVGVHINDTYAEDFDNFYNWLLSGPAEMVQVDNQYYQFAQAQIGPEATPIQVVGTGAHFYTQPLGVCTSITSGTVTFAFREGSNNWYLGSDNEWSFAFLYNYTANSYHAVICSTRAFNGYTSNSGNPPFGLLSNINTRDNTTGLYFYDGFRTPSVSQLSNNALPIFTTRAAGFAAIAEWVADPNYTDYLSVSAYDETGIADIPDTADPNYDALNRAKDIPLNIPWDDALYGDGTGTLTDAQTEAIASDVDLALVEDGVIELVEEANPPAPTPDEVFNPLLPVTLPSFNFSFSGIWHYVREWVSSLGAWFTTLFLIWSTLPYAMVVPVYATAVVVIVLGVYKRFFM